MPGCGRIVPFVDPKLTGLAKPLSEATKRGEQEFLLWESTQREAFEK